MDLLDRVATRDERALKLLYDLTASRLYGLALRIVANKEWAEDVLQESFLGIWRSAETYRDSLSPPLAWMGMLVRSRALDFCVGAGPSACISMSRSRAWKSCCRTRMRMRPCS